MKERTMKEQASLRFDYVHQKVKHLIDLNLQIALRWDQLDTNSLADLDSACDRLEEAVESLNYVRNELD